MSLILVTPYAFIHETIEKYRPTHMVSLLSPESMIDTPQEIESPNHLRLGLSDIAAPSKGQSLPEAEHVRELIAFGRNWDGRTPLLVHCWAGISRSMAAAFILMCDRAESGAEYAIAKKIRARAAHANPNRLLIRLADRALDRDGRMIDAVEDMGAAKFVVEGGPVEFPLAMMIR
jgi:predicted protein tyrosine phosphatase